ncbi:hypothetical protein P3T76_007421 [Phytophthora citrophthora]|uniref:RxLR effector protein n=1 Tax=Phytophthora citrophthora TaxID=4793 RepID=A0AAD9LLV3_9STRA|nr:hypothetical protein P3T76_007421 [Phytophthora citrophthora]
MRISFAILVAVVVAFTSCDLASASNSAQLKRLVPGLTNNVEKANGGARFLRKTRAMAFQAKRERAGDIGTRIKNVLNGNEKLARMFKKTDEKLMSKNIGPDELFRGAKRLENAGYSPEKMSHANARAKEYDAFFYKKISRTFNALRHCVRRTVGNVPEQLDTFVSKLTTEKQQARFTSRKEGK